MPDPSPNSTMDAILDAAIELFISQGFENTPMDKIAQTAGVAKGTLYYHYKSKEGIAQAIVERFAATMRAALEAIEARTDRDCTQKLGDYVLTMFELNSRYFGQLHRLKYIDIHQRLMQAAAKGFAPILGRLLAEGNKQGTCRAEFPLESAEFFLAASLALLDPDEGDATVMRRLSALVSLSARILGMEPALMASIYQPLNGLAKGES